MSPEGVYRLLFSPEGPPLPGGFWATGDKPEGPVRLFPDVPPFSENQRWLIRRTHDDVYTIKLFRPERGLELGFGIDGPIGPNTSVRLLPNNNEWALQPTGERDQYIISAVSGVPIGVRWIVDRGPEQQVVLRPYPISAPDEEIPRWQLVPVGDV